MGVTLASNRAIAKKARRMMEIFPCNGYPHLWLGGGVIRGRKSEAGR